MIRAVAALALCTGVWGAVAHAQQARATSLPTETEIKGVLTRRVDTLRQATGMVVGIIGPSGRRIVAYGKLAGGNSGSVDGDTVFEIGSLTKVFTSMLLADMVDRGEVSLADPVAKYLPRHVKMPKGGGSDITLVDLATHSSGLPRIPSNMLPKDPSNPYADYSAEQLYQFLGNYTLPRAAGSKYEYSNLGAGLLGLALARRAGMPYEELLESRVCRPMGMINTGITLSAEVRSRFATGHDALLAPMPGWDFDALAGAGAIKSSANDLLTLLSLYVADSGSRLASAARAMLAVRRPTGSPGAEVALGWHVLTRDGNEIVVHDGGTFGYRSFAGFNPKNRIAVVVLSNAFTLAGCNDIAVHILDPTAPLAETGFSGAKN